MQKNYKRIEELKQNVRSTIESLQKQSVNGNVPILDAVLALSKIELELKFLLPEIVNFENSSNILNATYFPDGKMEVEFTNGGRYLYKEVEREVFQDMVKSESVGKFFHKNVKNKYEYERVDPSEVSK